MIEEAIIVLKQNVNEKNLKVINNNDFYFFDEQEFVENSLKHIKENDINFFK